MPTWKKILTASTAVAALTVTMAGTASAAISAAGAVNYIASSTAPAGTQVFGTASNVVTVNTTGTGWGVGQLWTVGNVFTFTLNNGTFQTLPTVSVTGGSACTGTTAVYTSGGSGQAAVSYQLTGATPDVSCTLTLTGVTVNNVATAADGATVNLTLSDAAGALSGAGVAASARRSNIATFANPYSFTFNTTGAANTTVNLGAANPGAQYSVGAPTLGTFTVTPASVVQWSGTSAPALGAAGATLTVTVPTGPFVSATLGGTCSGSVTTQSAPGVITFTNVTGFPAVGGSATSCTVSLGQTPATATALLGTGATTGSLSVPITASPQATVVSPTGSFSSITFAGGLSVNAGYVTGDSSNYDSYYSVTTGASAGPVVVSSTADGATTSAVVSSSQAAKTNVLYSMATVRSALLAAGMSATSFAGDSNRGTLTIVVPTGSLVAPLLRNKSNGQVVEMSRQ